MWSPLLKEHAEDDANLQFGKLSYYSTVIRKSYPGDFRVQKCESYSISQNVSEHLWQCALQNQGKKEKSGDMNISGDINKTSIMIEKN